MRFRSEFVQQAGAEFRGIWNKINSMDSCLHFAAKYVHRRGSYTMSTNALLCSGNLPTIHSAETADVVRIKHYYKKENPDDPVK